MAMSFKQSSPITIEELRECPEFSHLDDCSAQIMIDTIQEFCIIVTHHYDKVNPEQLDEGDY